MSMRIINGLLLGVVLLSCSCMAAGGVALLAILLDDAAPTRVVSGTITYADGAAHAPALVQMKATVADDDDILVESDQIGETGGHYSIKFKWNSKVHYTFRIVTEDGLEIYNEELGRIEKQDFQKDVTLP